MEVVKKRAHTPWWLWVILAVAALAIGATAYVALHGRAVMNTLELMSAESQRFPAYADGELTAAQQKLVGIIKAEYEAQPGGTKYSEGVAEPWCADFVSWVARENGTPFVNPNSGSWRIPGTITLREYLEAKGVWHPYGSGYQPKVGDVAIYDGNGPFGQHTNFVMRNDNGELTTVGGNENGAIHVQTHTLNDDLHVLGFASL
jgi:hypothetical protein